MMTDKFGAMGATGSRVASLPHMGVGGSRRPWATLCPPPGLSIRASHMQLFWIFMLSQAVNTVKLNFKAGLFSSTFLFEHSFLAKSHL